MPTDPASSNDSAVQRSSRKPPPLGGALPLPGPGLIGQQQLPGGAAPGTNTARHDGQPLESRPVPAYDQAGVQSQPGADSGHNRAEGGQSQLTVAGPAAPNGDGGAFAQPHPVDRQGWIAWGMRGLQSPDGVKAPSLAVSPGVDRGLLQRFGLRLVAYCNSDNNLKLRFEIDPQTGNYKKLPPRPDRVYSTRGIGVSGSEFPLLLRVTDKLVAQYHIEKSTITFLYLVPMEIDAYIYAKQMQVVRSAAPADHDPRRLITHGNFYEANGELVFIITDVETDDGQLVRVQEKEFGTDGS